MKRQFKKTKLALQLLHKLDDRIIIDSISNHMHIYADDRYSSIDNPLLIYEMETGKLIRNCLDEEVAHTALQMICRRVTRAIAMRENQYPVPANFYEDTVDDVLYDKKEEQDTGSIEDYAMAKHDNPKIRQYLIEELTVNKQD